MAGLPAASLYLMKWHLQQCWSTLNAAGAVQASPRHAAPFEEATLLGTWRRPQLTSVLSPHLPSSVTHAAAAVGQLAPRRLM